MSRIFVPSSGPGDWRALLADPEKHWARKFSARTLAHCWEDADAFPPEIDRTLGQRPALTGAEPLFIFPEWKVPLPGGSRPSQNDVWVLAKAGTDLISIAIEGKVDESFDKPISDWLSDPSPGKEARLKFLTEKLGLSARIPGTIRYQLLHRAVSPIIEAERLGAKQAVMLVHSFSPSNMWFDDFAAFASLFGLEAGVDRLVSTTTPSGMPLHLGWVHGDERFLNA